MLDALRFVSGAVSKLDTVPALTHYRVEAGFVMGFNGTVALCSPIDLQLSATPNAEQFFRALKSCDDVVSITQQHNGTIKIKSGAFSTTVDCSPEPYPAVAPDGPAYAVKPGLCALLKKLVPIISNDANRLWMNGALFAQDGTITVTNGVVAAQAWTGDYFHARANVPAAALREVVRTGCDPIAMQWGEKNVTFHFDGGRWLRTSLFNEPWPIAKLDGVLNSACNPRALPEGFFAAVEKLVPFGDDWAKIELHADCVCVVDKGARRVAEMVVHMPMEDKGTYNGKLLLLLKNLATHVDFSLYPQPALWCGDNVRGAIIGMH